MWRICGNCPIFVLRLGWHASCQQPSNNLGHQWQSTGSSIHSPLLRFLSGRQRLVRTPSGELDSTLMVSRVFFRISGGLFNPAVTFGLCLIGLTPLVNMMSPTQVLTERCRCAALGQRSIAVRYPNSGRHGGCRPHLLHASWTTCGRNNFGRWYLSHTRSVPGNDTHCRAGQSKPKNPLISD